MATAALVPPLRTQNRALPRPASALTIAAGCWFLVAVAGQWLFVYYIMSFYGGPTAHGDFAAWNRNPLVQHGFVSGDPVGNLFFALHVLIAAVLTFSGPLQLVPALRRKAPVLHRWNGRVFMCCAIGASVAGLYLELARQSGSLVNSIAILVNAALILLFAMMAWRSARQGRVAHHHRWALRTFVAVSGVWFLRVAVGQSLFGFTPSLTASGFAILGLASYLVPLAVLEAYLHAADSGPRGFQACVAGLLIALTLFMALGIVGAFVFLWRPLLCPAGTP